MGWVRPLATSVVLALLLSGPVLAQAGRKGGSSSGSGSSGSSAEPSGSGSSGAGASGSGSSSSGSSGSRSSNSDLDKLPAIELTGVKAFDDVFKKAKKIETTLNTNTKAMRDARSQVHVTLGVAQDKPLATALGDLQKRSGDILTLAAKGTALNVVASKALPSNVSKGVVATNKMIKACQTTVTQTKSLGPQSEELARAAAAFPPKIPQLPSMGVKLVEVPKISLTLTNNARAIAAFPERVKLTLEEAEGILTDVRAVFPAGSSGK